MTWEAHHISQSIERPPAEVAAFAANPTNLPTWAAGLSAGIREVDGLWVTDSPMGVVSVAFVGDANAGILDHDGTLPDGTLVHNPLRVLRNDAGSEVVFTLFRHPGVSDEKFEEDTTRIVSDLENLRAILELPSP